MRPTFFALTFAASIAAASAKEHIVPVTWAASGDFRSELQIAAGKFKEVCTDLKQGDRIRWKFSGDSDTAFNIHFHEGDKVTYPARKEKVGADEGLLEVAVTQTYCWMWRASGQPARVQVALQKVDR